MFPRDSRRESRSGRPRCRPGRVAVEGLEGRQLLAYSPFGFSLPQLSVTGYAPAAAAWGGPITLDVTVENLGASSLVEPTHLTPGSVSNADSGPTTVEVYAAARPNANSGLVKVDTIDIANVVQNSDFETISTVPLPSRPAGFPGAGGKIYLTFVVNNSQAILQSSNANNVYRDPTAVRITDPLPDLQVVGFDVPQPLRPGDVITPTIRIANFGSADPAAQAPVTVELVASLDKNFGPGDAVVATYTIRSLPGLSGVPTRGILVNDTNVIPPPNVNTTTLAPIKLPTSPGFYYLGVKIDPSHAINQTYAPTPRLSTPVPVGPLGQFLPASALIATTTGTLPVFPQRPSLFLTPITTTPPPTLFPITPPGGFPPILALPTSAAKVKAAAVSTTHGHVKAAGHHAVARPKA